MLAYILLLCKTIKSNKPLQIVVVSVIRMIEIILDTRNYLHESSQNKVIVLGVLHLEKNTRDFTWRMKIMIVIANKRLKSRDPRYMRNGVERKNFC